MDDEACAATSKAQSWVSSKMLNAMFFNSAAVLVQYIPGIHQHSIYLVVLSAAHLGQTIDFHLMIYNRPFRVNTKYIPDLYT